MSQVDEVRAVIRLAVHALLTEITTLDDAEIADALDLADEELERLRDQIDTSWAASRDS